MKAGEPELRLQVGGTVNPRTGIYIVRPSDDELLELLERGEYANVLCSRQMGKSSLLVRTKTRLSKKGYAVAAIDVAGYLGSTSNADEWYRALLAEIVRQLHLSIDLPQWWHASRAVTPNQRLIEFFRDQVAAKLKEPVVIFMDEIDSTFRLPYTDDLFVALRAMYNDRAGEPLYDRLTFCLVGVASPNELIKDPRTTPYNIGRTIELEDFDLERDDLDPLFRTMSYDPAKGKSIIQSALKWTGGHPYLTVSLCNSLLESHCASDDEVEALINKQFANLDQLHSDVHFQQVLRFLGERVEDKIAALTLYRRICTGSIVRDHTTPAHIALRLTGLVKRDREGYLVVRNAIYGRVFSAEWVAKSLEPDVKAFEKLLDLLGPDRESAAEEYQRLHQSLVKIFLWRGSQSAEDLADETLDRVVSLLERGANISNLVTFCYGVANNILREQSRTKAQQLNLEDILSYPAKFEGDREASEPQFECLDRCLEKLSPQDRHLIVSYYVKEKKNKIQNREALAAQLGLPLNALRVRVYRIRQALEKCIRRCLAERAVDE